MNQVKGKTNLPKSALKIMSNLTRTLQLTIQAETELE